MGSSHQMPAVPKLAASPTKMAAAGTDLAFNPGGSITGSGGGAGGAAVPFFGFKESRGGGALVGTLYDLKQLAKGGPSKLDQDHGFPDEIAKFVAGGMNDSYFTKYFVAPKPLYTTQIFIPKIPADQGTGSIRTGRSGPAQNVDCALQRHGDPARKRHLSSCRVRRRYPRSAI